MKPITRFTRIAALAVMAGGMATTTIAQETIAEIDRSKLSYAVGYDIGMNLRTQAEDLPLDIEQVIQAVRDTQSEAEPRVAREEMRNILAVISQELQQKRIEEFRALADQNQTKSNNWLADNKSKDGIVELPSGVQYRVIESGNGARPGPTDTVTVHYRGSRMDGLEFDSSFARGTPQVFTVDKVLKGWQEVLPMMREGATWQVFVPPEMAFGVRGQPPVGPNEAVQFDLKLVQLGAPEGSGS